MIDYDGPGFAFGEVEGSKASSLHVWPAALRDVCGMRRTRWAGLLDCFLFFVFVFVFLFLFLFCPGSSFFVSPASHCLFYRLLTVDPGTC